MRDKVIQQVPPPCPLLLFRLCPSRLDRPRRPLVQHSDRSLRPQMPPEQDAVRQRPQRVRDPKFRLRGQKIKRVPKLVRPFGHERVELEPKGQLPKRVQGQS